ncbi:hypothetical protein D3C86_1377760 [compost metagenome]
MKARATFLALAGRLVAFDHLRPDLDLLGSGGDRALPEMHLAIAIDPTVDLCRCQSRQQQ